MADLINRDALINRLLTVCVCDDIDGIVGMGVRCGIDIAIDYAKEAPTIEAIPVAHPAPTITETRIFDKEEIIENCTVQILTNSETGETSVGWWKNV